MKDLAAGQLNDGQQKVAQAYGLLKSGLAEHRGELAPFEERNSLKALAALWQVMNGLDLDPGQLHEVGG